MLAKLEQKLKDHQDMIMVGVLTAAFAGVCVLLASAANKQAAETQQALNDAIGRGDTVLPNPDGSYWIISNQNQAQS